MLALEKCWVIVGWGSDAHYSVLSGKKHQGRTARRADEPLYRTALGGRCQRYDTTFRAHCYAFATQVRKFGRPSSRRRQPCGNVPLGQHSERSWSPWPQSPGCGSVYEVPFLAEATYSAASDALWFFRSFFGLQPVHFRCEPIGQLSSSRVRELGLRRGLSLSDFDHGFCPCF